MCRTQLVAISGGVVELAQTRSVDSRIYITGKETLAGPGPGPTSLLETCNSRVSLSLAAVRTRDDYAGT